MYIHTDQIQSHEHVPVCDHDKKDLHTHTHSNIYTHTHACAHIHTTSMHIHTRTSVIKTDLQKKSLCLVSRIGRYQGETHVINLIKPQLSDSCLTMHDAMFEKAPQPVAEETGKQTTSLIHCYDNYKLILHLLVLTQVTILEEDQEKIQLNEPGISG